MKKLLIVLTVLIAIAFSANAQSDDPAKNMSFGIKAGVIAAKHTGDGADDNHKVKYGGAFGVFMAYELSPGITIQPEVMYVMKGAEWEDDIETWKGTTNYLEIPVLIKYTFSMEGSAKPNLFVGPSLGFLLKAEEEGEYDGDPYSYDAKDFYKSTDFSLVIGGGVDVAMGQGVVTFDIRYSLGLSDINDYDEADLPPGTEVLSIKNAGILFLLGYGF